MDYFRKVADLETGEVRTISIGEHLTFTEAAQRFGVARSSLIKILLHLGLCQKEFDAVAGEYRYRLHPAAQKKGLGYRIMGPHGPFDVLAPTALEWIEADLKALLSATTMDQPTIAALQALDRFEAGRSERLDVEGRVRWLKDHFPDLPVRQVAKGLGVSERIVHRYLKKQDDQLRRALEARFRVFPSPEPVFTDQTREVSPA